MMYIPLPNRITECSEDFYISYNNRDINIYDSDTTALVIGQMEKFYILNGNHVKAYERLMSLGLDACIQYFVQNGHLIAKYSDKL